LEDTDRVLCVCGSLVSIRSRYCGFCGNRVEIVSPRYIQPGTYQVAVVPKPKEEEEQRDLVDYDMTSPSWIKIEGERKARKTTIREIKSKKRVKTRMKAGSPVPLFLIMTSVMIWIGGVIFFFVEITF
jgi:hypothetical protein